MVRYVDPWDFRLEITRGMLWLIKKALIYYRICFWPAVYYVVINEMPVPMFVLIFGNVYFF